MHIGNDIELSHAGVCLYALGGGCVVEGEGGV